MNINSKYDYYKNQIDSKLINFVNTSEPKSLYEPVKYVLAGGGKRIRPILTIFCCEAFGGKHENAVDAAIAMEVLHNFTLVHDDIMDNADTRRGRDTVHIKWDRDTAILAGDQLVAMAYNSLLKSDSKNIKLIAKIFTDTIEDVCEGQSYDKDFEKRNFVTEEEYILMIRKKTAKLLEGCAMIGAVLGGADESGIEAVRKFSEYTGLAFQIQDDLLDITGDEASFGKRIGGDVSEGKKTFLLVKAFNEIKCSGDKTLILKIWNKEKEINNEDFIKLIKSIYIKYGIMDSAVKEIERYTNLANLSLEQLKLEEGKELLRWFSNMLLNRKH